MVQKDKSQTKNNISTTFKMKKTSNLFQRSLQEFNLHSRVSSTILELVILVSLYTTKHYKNNLFAQKKTN